MPKRKEDEIMAEYLLKGGKMLEKVCKTCGCPLFEVKGRTLCVVCAENEATDKDAKNAKGVKQPPSTPVQGDGGSCACGEDHGGESCTCSDDGGMLADEIALTILSLCKRIQDEKDPENVLTLMHSVKAGTEALGILCRL